jgi:hypothetical protein
MDIEQQDKECLIHMTRKVIWWVKQIQQNPQYAQLWEQLQSGFDPRVRQQLQGVPALQQQILGGGFFGGAEEQTFRDLISGQTLAGQGGTLYDLIQEQFAPAREQARGYAASRGFAPGTGSAMTFEGQVQGGQQRAFAEQMVNKYLDMVGMGTAGLGQMGGEQLARQQSVGNLGQWLSQFVEGAQQNRMQLGLGITQAQQAPLMQLLQMHQQQRQSRGPKGWEAALGALTDLAPMAMPFMFPKDKGGGDTGRTDSPWEYWSIPGGGI